MHVPVRIGQRVQTPAHSDAWMRGDRFGTVESHCTPRGAFSGEARVMVRLDKSNRLLRFVAADLTDAS